MCLRILEKEKQTKYNLAATKLRSDLCVKLDACFDADFIKISLSTPG